MKKYRTTVVASMLVVAIASIATPAGADVADAAGWLRTQQQADGGFEVAGFAGFETADAVLALAESVNQPGAWDSAAAREAVGSVTSGTGRTPYDAIDDEAELGPTAGGAAKLIALVAAPGGWETGLSPVAFDPSGDGAAVDLVATMVGGLDTSTGTFGTFGDTLLAVLAHRQLCLALPEGTIGFVAGAAAPSGGWNFAGDPNDDVFDPDITGRALQALAAAGIPADDPAVAAGLRRLAVEHDGATGAWFAFGEANPNSTAMAMLALDAYGLDPASRQWRDDLAPERSAEPYTAPADYLLGQQLPSGQFASPSDAFGVNTFATSQAVQALSRAWTWTAPTGCPDLTPPPPSPTTTTVPPTSTTTATTVAPDPGTGPPTGGAVQVAGSSQTATSQALAETGAASGLTVAVAGLLLLLGLAAVTTARVIGADTVGQVRRKSGGQ